jgi:hypothetical protein
MRKSKGKGKPGHYAKPISAAGKGLILLYFRSEKQL